MFLKIIDSNGSEELVNVNNVICIAPSGSGTTFQFVSGRDKKISVPFAKVTKALVKNEAVYFSTASPETK